VSKRCVIIPKISVIFAMIHDLKAVKNDDYLCVSFHCYGDSSVKWRDKLDELYSTAAHSTETAFSTRISRYPHQLSIPSL
jgi:hypothetical protein